MMSSFESAAKNTSAGYNGVVHNVSPLFSHLFFKSRELTCHPHSIYVASDFSRCQVKCLFKGCKHA